MKQIIIIDVYNLILGFDITDIKTTKFERQLLDENCIQSQFNKRRVFNCNIDSLNTIGDYDINKEANSVIFGCDFDKEIKENETIEEG